MRRLAHELWIAIPMNWRASRVGRLFRASYHSCINAWGDLLDMLPKQGARRESAGNATKILVSHLEVHITHKCNLTCEGCLHFTNHRHSGTLPIDDLRKSMSLWNKRLVPEMFAILGGEPCLHRDLVDIVYMTREMWPDPKTKMELVTNGLLLHLHPGLPQALVDADMRLSISIHSNGSISRKYQEKISRSLELAKEWQKKFGFELREVPSTIWARGYTGFGSEIMPFEDNKPRKSWKNCITGQNCFQLFEDRLWKCAPLAYLKLQEGKFNLSDKWKPYLSYEPLKPDCTDEEIIEFFNRKAENVCAMCPSDPQEFTKRDPLLPLNFYKGKSWPHPHPGGLVDRDAKTAQLGNPSQARLLR